MSAEPPPLVSPRTESLLLTPGGKTVREDDGLPPLSSPRSQNLKKETTNTSAASYSKQQKSTEAEDRAIKNRARETAPMSKPGAVAVSGLRTSGPDDSVMEPKSNFPDSLTEFDKDARYPIVIGKQRAAAPKSPGGKKSPKPLGGKQTLSPQSPGKSRPMAPAIRPGAVTVAGSNISEPEIVTENSSVAAPKSPGGKKSPKPLGGKQTLSPQSPGKSRPMAPAVRPGAVTVAGSNTSEPEIMAETSAAASVTSSSTSSTAKTKRTSPAVRPGAVAVAGRKTSGHKIIDTEVEPGLAPSISDSDQVVMGRKTPPALTPDAMVAVAGGGAEDARSSSNDDSSGPSYMDDDDAPRSSVAARDGAAKEKGKGSSSELSYIDSEIVERSEDTSSNGARDREAKRRAKDVATMVRPGAVAVESSGKQDSPKGKASSNRAATRNTERGAVKAGAVPVKSSRKQDSSKGKVGSNSLTASDRAATRNANRGAVTSGIRPEYIDDEITGTRKPSLKLGSMGAHASDAFEDSESHDEETAVADKPGVVALAGSGLTGTKFAAASSSARSTASATSTGESVGSSAVSQAKNAGSSQMALSVDSILDGPAYNDDDEMKEEEDDTVADTTAMAPSESIAAFSRSNVMSDPEDGEDSFDPGSPTQRTSNSNRPEVTRALSAELVTAEAFNEEEERERIRNEAEKDAQHRLLDGAILASAEVIPDDEEIEKGLNKKLYGTIACVVLIAVIVIASVLATKPDEKSPTPGPPFNDICETAFFANATGDVITGTISARAGTDNVTCQRALEDGGFGLWYSLQGNGERLRASTCDGAFRDIDTQVLVLTDSCKTLLCVGGSDQVCGDQSSIGWLAEEDTEYFILVRGFRASNTGNFTLTVEPLVDNGSCDDAFQIKEGGISLIGSTRDLTSEDSIETCSSSSSAAATDIGAWYSLGGDGNIQCASVFTEDRSAQLSIFAGDSCTRTDLTCADGLDNVSDEETSITIEFTWITEDGAPYFLVVHGSDVEQAGDFELDVHSPPANNLCTTAFDVPADGSVQAGTTIGACRGGTNQCGRKVDAAGVWYSVQGTGDRMVASTCNTKSDFGLQMSVLTGSCDDSECVDFEEEACDAQSAVSWLSDQGTIYNLFVQGFNPQSNGDFELTVQEMILRSSF